PTGLSARLAATLGNARVPVTILLASGDNTAIAFADLFKGPAFADARARVTVETLDSASHSFAGAAEKEWLLQRVLEHLA
ncbi:MAG TPA: thioesterase, partial [Sphingomonas sp.]|nr:thioesterase [Sphingomonas sp.]